MKNLRLFHVPPKGPPGFRYEPEFITPEEERALLKEFERVPLHTFTWDGYESKRRVKSYTKETGYPAPLLRVMERAAKFLELPLDAFEHAMVAEYVPGTGIGWHRDQPPYDKIIGLSLGSAVPFRFRKIESGKEKRKWERITLTAEPRSLYVMASDSRSRWQHSIPPVEKLRYSITMRTVEKLEKLG